MLNKQGIVRYHAALRWPHGNRYHLNEILGSVDSLVTAVLDVPGGSAVSMALSAAPNPSRGSVRVTLVTPRVAPRAQLTVHDVAGREIAMLWSGALDAGVHEFVWDSRDAGGVAVRAGLYLVRAVVGSERRVRRVVVAR